MADVMTGRLGGESEGFDLKAKLDGDTVTGRAGGIFGKDFQLEISATGVSGHIGHADAQQVSLELASGELSGFIGGASVRLRGVDQVTGSLGEGITALQIFAQQRGEDLIGNIGGMVGRPFKLSLNGAPGWIGVLVALVAYCALDRT